MRRGNAMLAVESIGSLIHVIDELSRLPRRVATIAAPRITRLQQRQFVQGVDPYGRKWRGLKPSTLARGRRNPPLTDTHRLKDGTRSRIARGNRAGMRLETGARYGYFHQVGFHVGNVFVGPRRILPQFGMPRAWREVLDLSSRQAAQEARRYLR